MWYERRILSRVTNLRTGETMMTEMNALRYYLAKGKKALKSNDYERMKKIWNDASSVIDAGLCFCCIHDDIGYCGLRRNSDITEEEKFVKFCFPSVLKWWESQINKKRR